MARIKPKLTKKQLRLRKAVNIAASLIHSGVAKANLSKLSAQTLSAALAKEKGNTPKARAIADALTAKGNIVRKKPGTDYR